MSTPSAAQTEGAHFIRYIGPLLDALRALGGSGRPSEVVAQIAKDLSVPEAVQAELTESGVPRFYNRVAWARFYLSREGLLDASKRGVWSLPERGRATHLDASASRALFLKWVKHFQAERKRKKGEPAPEAEPPTEAAPPPGLDYRERLLRLLLDLPPRGFERLCQRLLRESGFTQVNVTGRSGDGGIDGDGTLQVNALVSFRVLFQCKRRPTSVTSPEIRNFRGAMQGRTDKGIFLTTGSFTADAREEATRDGVPPIELVDGPKLVDMFAELELGLRKVSTYDVDDSFFDDFRDKTH
jgi:restriction system protein